MTITLGEIAIAPSREFLEEEEKRRRIEAERLALKRLSEGSGEEPADSMARGPEAEGPEAPALEAPSGRREGPLGLAAPRPRAELSPLARAAGAEVPSREQGPRSLPNLGSSTSDPGYRQAVARRDYEDGLRAMLEGIVSGSSGGRARLDLPGSRAVQDYLEGRRLGRQERADALTAEQMRTRERRADRESARQSRIDARSQERHLADMRTIGLRAEQLRSQVEAARTDASLRARLQDPSSRESENARGVTLEYIRNLEEGAGIPDAPPIDLADLRQAVEGESAWELANNEALEAQLLHYSRLREGLGRQRRTRRTGGSGRVSRGAGADPVVEIFVEDFARARNLNPDSPEVQDLARSVWSDMGGRERRAYSSSMARSVASNTATEGRMTDREQLRLRRNEMQERVPGYVREEGAPELTSTERRDAREAPILARNVREASLRMAQLAEEVGALQAAGARAGVLDERLAEARAVHESIITAMRNIGNYGVPQAQELVRMEAIAPRLDSVQGFLSAANQYPALADEMSRQVRIRMEGLGYRPDTGGSRGGGGRLMNPQTGEVRAPRNRDEARQLVREGFTEVVR